MIIIPIKKFQNPFKSLRARNQHLNFIAPQEEPKKRRYVKNWWCTCLLFENIERKKIIQKLRNNSWWWIARSFSWTFHFIWSLFYFEFSSWTWYFDFTLFSLFDACWGTWMLQKARDAVSKIKNASFSCLFSQFFLDNTTDSPDFFLRLLHPILVWV